MKTEEYVLDSPKNIQPFHLTLGNGWTISCYNRRSSSVTATLALCKFSAGESHINARLDLGKRIFIDETPTPVSKEIIGTLITLIGWFSDGK